MIIRENISFKRSMDPKDSMRIGKWAEFKGMDPEEVANKIYDTILKDSEIKRILKKGSSLIKKEGFYNWDDYFDYFETGSDPKEDIEDCLTAFENRVSELIDNKFPIIKGKEENVKGIIFMTFFRGLSIYSKMRNITGYIDTDFLNESINFERGKDPKDSMGLGDEGLRILNKLSTIAKSVGAKEVGIDDLNKKMVIASWRIPGIRGPIEGIGYGRITLYKNQVGNYMVHTKGVRGSDIQQWQMWNSARKWIENIKMLKESINFERGKDPKSTMGIGYREKIAEMYEEIEEEVQRTRSINFQYDFSEEAVNLVKKYGLSARHGWGNFNSAFDMLSQEQFAEVAAFTKKWYKKIFGKNESVNFKRGKNPKSTMKIGLEGRTLHADFLSVYPFNSSQREEILDGRLQPEDAHEVLKNLYSNRSSKIDIISNWNPPKFSSYSIKYLIGDLNNNFEFIEYEGEVYEIPEKNQIGESINFERGKNPKSSMGLGIESRSLEISGVFDSRDEIINTETAKIILENMDYKVTHENYVHFYTENGDISRYTIEYLVSDHQTKYDYINFEGEYYPIPGKNNDFFFNKNNIGGSIPKRIVKESINFERGQEPKDTMDIGMGIFDIDGMELDDYDGNHTFSEEETADVLNKPELWTTEPFSFLRLSKINPPYSKRSYSLLYLATGPGEYDYIRYKDKLYPIPNPKNRISKISESINFERGKNPAETMGIGDEEARLINKIESIILPLGFKRNKTISVPPEEYVHDIAEWHNNNGVTVVFYELKGYSYDSDSLRPSKYLVSLYDSEEAAPFDEMDSEDFIKPYVWDNVLARRPKHWTGESINFDRGKNPMDRMKLGNYQERIITKGLFRIAEFFNEPWLEKIIPEYTKMIMDTGMIIEDMRGIKIGNTDYIYVKGEYPNGDIYETTMEPSKSPAYKEDINTGINLFFKVLDELKWQKTINRDKFDS